MRKILILSIIGMILIAGGLLFIWKNDGASYTSEKEIIRNGDGLDRDALQKDELPVSVQYKSEDKVEIKNTDTTEAVATIELLSDNDFKVIDSGNKEQVILTFRVNNTLQNVEFGSFLFGINLIDKTKDKNIQREISYYKRTISGYYYTLHQTRECESINAVNGSNYQRCIPVNEKVQNAMFSYEKLEADTLIPIGVFEIEARTDIQKGDNVEWTLSFFGSGGKVNDW